MNHYESNHRFKFLGKCSYGKCGPSKIKLAYLRFVAIVFATLLGAVLAIYLYPAVIFYPMGRLLLRDNHPANGADFIVLLMGEASLRPAAAAKAVLAGTANHVLFVSTQTNSLVEAGLIPSEDDLARAMLTRGGLDASRFTMISEFGRATSTVDEALALKNTFTPCT